MALFYDLSRLISLNNSFFAVGRLCRGSMAGVHEKKSKWFNDRLKREKQKSNIRGLKEGEAVDQEHEPSLAKPFYDCCYCIKVFIDSKFLLKHVLRRHSDKLIQLHKKVIGLTKSVNAVPYSSDLYNFLKSEFSDLKVEVEDVKKILTGHIEEKQGECRHNSKASVSFDPTFDETKEGSIQSKISEADVEVSENQASPADFQNLQARVDKLFEMFEESITSKEDIRNTIALNEERMCQNMKNELLNEFQNMLFSHQQKNSAECKTYFGELRKEISRLEKTVELNSKKIDSPDNLKEIQKNFECQIQNLLNSHSVFTPNTKDKKLNRSKVLDNEQNHSLKAKMNRRKRNIYTLNSLQIENSFIKTSKKEDVCSSYIPRTKNKKSERLCKFNSLVNNSENFTEHNLSEARLMIDEKLRCLNVAPQTDKLSSEEFEKKMRLVNSEKEVLSKKFESFLPMREKLDSFANECAKSKLIGKTKKKLCFSDSPRLPSPVIADEDLCSKVVHAAHKQDSSGFLISSEIPEVLYAGGDSAAISKSHVNEEKFFPIEENVEHVLEGSCNDYIFKPLLSKDCSFSKEFSPGDLPNYFTARNIANNGSRCSISQKSVEDMSDMSSLELDTLEDQDNDFKGVI